MLLGLLSQRLEELGVNLQQLTITDWVLGSANQRALCIIPANKRLHPLRDHDEADLVGDPELVREAGGVPAHLGGHHAPHLPTWSAQGVAFELNQLKEDSYCQLFWKFYYSGNEGENVCFILCLCCNSSKLSNTARIPLPVFKEQFRKKALPELE